MGTTSGQCAGSDREFERRTLESSNLVNQTKLQESSSSREQAGETEGMDARQRAQTSPVMGEEEDASVHLGLCDAFWNFF